MLSLSGLFGIISPLLLVVAISSFEPLKLFLSDVSDSFRFSLKFSVELSICIFSFSRIDCVLFAAFNFW